MINNLRTELASNGYGYGYAPWRHMIDPYRHTRISNHNTVYALH